MTEGEHEEPATRPSEHSDGKYYSVSKNAPAGHRWTQTISNVVITLATVAIAIVTARYTHYAGQ